MRCPSHLCHHPSFLLFLLLPFLPSFLICFHSSLLLPSFLSASFSFFFTPLSSMRSFYRPVYVFLSSLSILSSSLLSYSRSFSFSFLLSLLFPSHTQTDEAHYMTATSHNSPQTKSCTEVLHALPRTCTSAKTASVYST